MYTTTTEPNPHRTLIKYFTLTVCTGTVSVSTISTTSGTGGPLAQQHHQTGRHRSHCSFLPLLWGKPHPRVQPQVMWSVCLRPGSWSSGSPLQGCHWRKTNATWPSHWHRWCTSQPPRILGGYRIRPPSSHSRQKRMGPPTNLVFHHQWSSETL